MIEKRTFRICNIVSETADVKTFRLIPVDKKPFKFKAGQFVNVFLDDVCRPYSISSSPKNPDVIELTIKLVNGKMTSKIAKLKEDDEVQIAGPFGDFSFDSDVVMIACGIGLPPMMSHIREILDKKLRKNVVLFYSARTKNDMLFRDVLDKIQGDCPSVKVVYIITREKPQGLTCENRRFDLEMLKKYVSNPEKKHYLVCGPIELGKDVAEILQKLKVPAENIKKECWG